MKKLIALLLCLLLCFLALSAFAEDDSVVGTWYLSRAVYNGVDCPTVDNEAMTLTVNEGGTIVLAANFGNLGPYEGTWTLSDSVITLVVEDDPLECPIVDGEMILESDNMTVYLSRTPAAPKALPAVVQAGSADAFAGRWLPVAQISSYLYIPLNENTEYLLFETLTIDDKEASFVTDNHSDVDSLPIAYEYAFEDGVLTVEDESNVPTDMTFSLREDGSLFVETVMHYDDMPIAVTSVFVREDASDEAQFVTVQEWLDARGNCGNCMMLLKVQQVINPVLAVVADETGSVNLYSGQEGEPIVWLMNEEQDLTGYWIVIANPVYNEYEGTVELAGWKLLRMVPGIE